VGLARKRRAAAQGWLNSRNPRHLWCGDKAATAAISAQRRAAHRTRCTPLARGHLCLAELEDIFYLGLAAVAMRLALTVSESASVSATSANVADQVSLR
jgi:hypothetical protein